MELQNNTILIAVIGIVCLLIGAGAGYFLLAPTATTNVTGNVTTTTAFVVDNSKVQTQIDAMNKFYTLMGQPVNITIKNSALISGGLVEVNVSSSDGENATFYFTNEYKFIAQPPIDLVNYTAEAEIQLKAEAASAATANTTNPATTAPTATKTDKPKIELFVMSYCPYGNQAENGLYTVISAFNNTIDFQPVYIISGSAGKWNSLHGAPELNQGIRETIIYNLYGTQVWNEYVHNANTICTLANIETCWKDAAKNVTVINVSKVEELYGTTFDEVAKANADKSTANKVSGSPTMLINGVNYNGGRTPVAYQTGICAAFTTQPSACNATLSGSAPVASGSCG